MSELTDAIDKINASASATTRTTTFFDDVGTAGDNTIVTNPNNGKQTPSIKKQVKDQVTPELQKWEGEHNAQMDKFDKEFYEQAQYKPAIPWAATTAVSDKFQLYSESTNRYRPNPSKIPFTTGATIADDIANDLWITYAEATLDQVNTIANAGDSQLAGGKIWPVENRDTKINDSPVSATFFKFTHGVDRALYRAHSPVTGTIDAIGVIGDTVEITVNGNSVIVKKINKERLDFEVLMNGGVVPFDGDFRLKVGVFITVDDYALNHDSGVLFFKVVPSGTGVHDGGKYIDLPISNLQLEQNLRTPYDVKAWGASKILSDSTSQIQAAFNHGGCVIIPTEEFVVTGLTGVGNLSVIGFGTLRNTTVKPCIDLVSLDNVTIRDISIIGSNTQSTADPQDGDKGIFLNGCTNSKIEGVKTSNTFAWGVIQAGSCKHVDFINLSCKTANNQSCIAITNGSSYANVINCTSSDSHLYGLEIERNVSEVTVYGQSSSNCVAGVSIAFDCENISVLGSFLIDNNNQNNVPPNPPPAVNGVGLQVLNSKNITISNTVIRGSERVPVFISNGLNIAIDNGCKIDAYPTKQDLDGIIYIVSTGTGTIPNSGNVRIEGNQFDCHGVEPFVYCPVAPWATGSIINNVISNPDPRLIILRGNGAFSNNRIQSTFPSDPVGGIFEMDEAATGDISTPSISQDNPTYKYIPKVNEVILGVSLTFIPKTVTGNPQWFLRYNGVNYLIGLTGTGYPEGVPTTQQVKILKRVTANTNSEFSIVSTTGDVAEYMSMEIFTMKIVVDI